MAANATTTPDPLVSVVVPIYNIEPFVADAVYSVMAQTMDDWELICVDDGSRDNSLSICQELAACDERILVVTQEHAGQGVARNRGISLARGKYVYFLDGDDMIVSGALERCVRIAEEADADMVQFGARIIAEDGAKHDADALTRSKEYQGIWSGVELYLAQRGAGDYYASPCLYLSRSALLVDSGGCSSGGTGVFPPGFIHEDQSATYRLLTSASRVVCLPDLLYVRRYRLNSTMTNRDWNASTRGYFRAYALAYSDMTRCGSARGLRARADRLQLDLVRSLCTISFYLTGAPVDEFASVCGACAGDEAALESMIARRDFDPRFFPLIRQAKLARWRLGPIRRRLTTMLRRLCARLGGKGAIATPSRYS